MNWLNIDISLLRSAEFDGATPEQQATWLKLLAYCADQETSGIIRDAHRWRDSQWLRIGIQPGFLDQSCPLWRIEVGHLRVWGYPIDQEKVIRSKRKGGQKGGRHRWDNKVVEMPAQYQAGQE